MGGKHRKFWLGTLAVLVLIIIAARVVAPLLILTKLNDYLANFSPTYTVQINNLHLAIWRGAYRFDGVAVHLKSDNKVFATMESIDISIAWRALLQGRILTDVDILEGKFILSKSLMAGSKAPEPQPKEKTQAAVPAAPKPKEDAQNAAGTLFPLRVARVLLRDSQFEYEGWAITNLDGWVTNVNPTPFEPKTQFAFKGALADSSNFRVAGEARRLEKPMAWEADLEVKDFDLVEANPLLINLVPFTFTAGHLDVFAEAKSEKDRTEGYVKPFLKKVKVLHRDQKFVGVKHFAFELLGALGNLILRKPDDQTVAARIPFHTENGSLKVGLTQILPSAIKHGFGDPLPHRLDNTVHLSHNN